MQIINILIQQVFAENIVFHKFLGLCPFVGVSKNKTSSMLMGITITIVTIMASVISYLIYQFALVPSNTEYLSTLSFVLVIASLVQVLQILLKSYFKKIYDMFGIYLPLITTNCAVLGVVLMTARGAYPFLEMLIYSTFAPLGFTFAIIIFAIVKERIELSKDIPDNFKGMPISFITAGILALIFAGYVI